MEANMRFGIMDMQLDLLVGAAGGSTGADLAAQAGAFDHAALVAQLYHAGFNLIELGGDLTLFFPGAYAPESIEKLRRLKQDKGLAYTVHLPLWSVEPSTLLQPVRKGSVQALVENIRATLPLEPEIYVLHATGALAAEFSQMRLPEQVKSLLLRQFQGQAAESIKTILGETGIPSRQLAIETIEFPFELTVELANVLDTSICLDVGHVLAGFSGPIELFEALPYLLPRLGEVHLHDAPWQGEERNIGYGKDHQALGKGDLDVVRLLDRLAETHFDGPIIFELSVPEAKESLDVLWKLCPQFMR